MLVKEKNLTIFQDIKALGITEIFESLDVNELDDLYNSTYGERTLSPYGEHGTAEGIAGFLKGLYLKKWEFTFSISNNQDMIYDTIESYTSNKASDSTNKVSGYDSNTLIDDTGSSENGTNNYDKKTQKRDTDKKVIDFLNSVLIYDIMFKDINKILIENKYLGGY